MKHLITCISLSIRSPIPRFFAIAALLVSTPGFAHSKSLEFEAGGNCFELNFDQGTNEVFSCKNPTIVKYSQRECKGGNRLDSGKSRAQLTCPNDKKWEMKFNTFNGEVAISLTVNHNSKGRIGMVSEYKVTDARFEKTPTAEAELEKNENP